MSADAPWYEAAYVAGLTNALNVVADGLRLDGSGPPILDPPAAEALPESLAPTLAAIQEFFAVDKAPATFRVLAANPGYLTDFWAAYRRAFEDRALTRKFKEGLAFAISVTTRSAWGAELHLAQARRLGLSDAGAFELLGVAQMFSSFTKIADVLRLEPDAAMIAAAPPDLSPPPSD